MPWSVHWWVCPSFFNHQRGTVKCQQFSSPMIECLVWQCTMQRGCCCRSFILRRVEDLDLPPAPPPASLGLCGWVPARQAWAQVCGRVSPLLSLPSAHLHWPHAPTEQRLTEGGWWKSFRQGEKKVRPCWNKADVLLATYIFSMLQQQPVYFGVTVSKVNTN